MAAGRTAPARSHQRRGHRRWGTGSTRSIGHVALVGRDVLDEQGWNTVGGEEGRRSRRRASIPGEGPADMGNQSAQEHRGEVRVQFPYSIWPRRWRRRVVDDEAVLVASPARGGTASGQFRLGEAGSSTRAGRGASGGGEGALGAGIWAGWSSHGEIRRGALGWFGGREEEEEEIRRGDGVRADLYRRALRCRREGEGEQAQGRAQVGGQRCCALRVRVAAARHRQPDVAGRREATGGCAGGGRSSKATRGARGGWRRSAAGLGNGRRRWITSARQRQRRSGTRGRR
jgi:hypothetical protein